jgi:hypothetical protein
VVRSVSQQYPELWMVHGVFSRPCMLCLVLHLVSRILGGAIL